MDGAPFMVPPASGDAGTPSDEVSVAPDADQFQRGSAPQPMVGAPTANTAPGGVYSYTAEGGPEHNASFLTPVPPLGGGAPKVSGVDAEKMGPRPPKDVSPPTTL